MPRRARAKPRYIYGSADRPIGLCAATGRYAEAATLWAAHAVHFRQQGLVGQTPGEARREAAALSKIRQALGPPGSGRLKSVARR